MCAGRAPRWTETLLTAFLGLAIGEKMHVVAMSISA